MTKSYSIIIAFALILAFVIGFQVLNLFAPVIQAPDLEPRISNDGPVTVTVAPSKSISADTLEFEIILETHSVELNEDLMKYAILIADNKNYEPIAWNGDPLGGHHRKGILRFASISPQPKSIVLKILRIGGIEERNFIWQLK